MEILQTIWSALATENVMLTKIITSFLMFIELSISMLLFTTILNISVNRKQKILYVLILSFIGIVTLWILPTPFNTFINILACPILVYYLFKTNLLKAVLAEIIPYVVFFIISYILMTALPSNTILNIPIYKLSFSLIMYLLVYLIYLISKAINFNSFEINLINSKKHWNLLICLLIGTTAIFIQAYILGIYKDALPLVLTFSSLSALLIYFLFSLYSLSRTNKLEITTESLEQEKLYNKTLTILYDNIRGFKHDFNNIVQAIGGYISTDNMEGLKDYYSDLVADCRKSNNLAILNPELINNPAVYSLLTAKYHQAEELGITINFDIFMDLQTLNIKTYDLTRILGILLDNAIDACNKCDEKYIYITIRKDSKANRQLIIIENTYSNKTVDTERIFEKGYTSKLEDDGKNHGLGLWEVREILKKNNNLNLHTTKSMRIFTQQLEIYS